MCIRDRRTAVELVTGETLEKVEFHDVRGTDGIKEASYDVGLSLIHISRGCAAA